MRAAIMQMDHFRPALFNLNAVEGAGLNAKKPLKKNCARERRKLDSIKKNLKRIFRNIFKLK